MAIILFVGTQLPLKGLKGLLAGSVFTTVAEAGTLAEAHRWLCAVRTEDHRPQTLLMYLDGRLDADDGEMLRAIRRDRPTVKVIILGDPASLTLLLQVCPKTIDGYLPKDMLAAALMQALHLVMSGQQIFPPASPAAGPGARSTQEAPIYTKATIALSGREAQILQFLVLGSSNKAIARELTISSETVKVHMRALLRKLNARNRTQVALCGLENGYKPAGPFRRDNPKPLAHDDFPHIRVALRVAVGMIFYAVVQILDALAMETGLAALL